MKIGFFLSEWSPANIDGEKKRFANLQTAFFLSLQDNLLEHGIQLSVNDESASIYWVSFSQWENFPWESSTEKSLIIDEITDICDVHPQTRKMIRNYGNIVGITKTHIYRQAYRYGLRPAEFVVEEEYPCIDRWTDLIHATIGYGALPRLEFLKTVSIDYDRPIDVFFAGTMQYGGFQPVEEHRKQCCDAIESACNNLGLRAEVIRGRKISTGDYWRLMLQSKICVSPWGWGAPCHRDAEAILCGCALIKPACNWVKTWPDIYTTDHYSDCKRDFSDLESVIEKSSTEFPHTQLKRERIRRKLIADTTPDVLAGKIAGVLKECASRA